MNKFFPLSLIMILPLSFSLNGFADDAQVPTYNYSSVGNTWGLGTPTSVIFSATEANTPQDPDQIRRICAIAFARRVVNEAMSKGAAGPLILNLPLQAFVPFRGEGGTYNVRIDLHAGSSLRDGFRVEMPSDFTYTPSATMGANGAVGIECQLSGNFIPSSNWTANFASANVWDWRGRPLFRATFNHRNYYGY